MDSVTFENTFWTLSLENVKIHPEHYCKKGKNTVKTTSITRSTWAKSPTWKTVPINQHICAKLWLYHNIENWIKWSFIYKDLRPVHPRMLCAKFCRDGSNLSWEDAFQISSMLFWVFQRLLKYCPFIFAISLSSLLGKWRGTSFEQTWILFTQEWFVQSLIEISSVALEKFVKFPQCIFAILLLSPFRKVRALHLNKLETPLPTDDLLMYEKGQDHSFEQTWILFTQGCLVSSLVEIGSVVLVKRTKGVKLQQDDAGQISIRKAHLSLPLRWSKKGRIYL